MRRTAALLLTLALLAGCATKAPAPVPNTPAGPSTPATPQPGPDKPADAGAPPAGALAVPSVQAGAAFLPFDLSVAEDGRVFGLWRLESGGTLMAWGTGDREAVTVNRVSLTQIAFTADGFYYVKVSTEGKPQIRHYGWGDKKDQAVVETDKLVGFPRGLHYIANTGLVYADDEGMKAVELGKAPAKLPSPGLPVSLHGHSFEPGSDRYVTVAGGQLVLASLASTETMPMAAMGPLHLVRVAWEQGTGKVAVELTDPQNPGMPNSVYVFDESVPGKTRGLFRGEGFSPALLKGRLYRRIEDRLLEDRMDGQGGQPITMVQRDAGAIVADSLTSRLYLVYPSNQTGTIPYLEIK